MLVADAILVGFSFVLEIGKERRRAVNVMILAARVS
jgi:hypothetical protein